MEFQTQKAQSPLQATGLKRLGHVFVEPRPWAATWGLSDDWGMNFTPESWTPEPTKKLLKEGFIIYYTFPDMAQLKMWILHRWVSYKEGRKGLPGRQTAKFKSRYRPFTTCDVG